LTNLLRPTLTAAGGALVVNTSSIANLVRQIVFDDLDLERRRCRDAAKIARPANGELSLF
jgi:hypothetical protein